MNDRTNPFNNPGDPDQDPRRGEPDQPTGGDPGERPSVQHEGNAGTRPVEPSSAGGDQPIRPATPPPVPPRVESGGQAADAGGAPGGGGAPPPPHWTPQPPPSYQPGGQAPRRRFSVLRLLLMLVGFGFLGFIVLSMVIGIIGRTLGGGGGGLAIGSRLGVVRIEGMISQNPNKAFWMENLRKFAEDPQIKGVLVRLESPGGTVAASQEVYQMLLEIRNQGKPVYASMGDIAASGAYYIASATDRIYSNKGTLTGSIGVIFSKPELSELTEKMGIDQEIVKSGRFKDAGAITRPMSEAERRMFDMLIDSSYDQFLDDILSQRSEAIAAAAEALAPQRYQDYQFDPNIPKEPRAFLEQVADGRVYTGIQALELGLIDEIGTYDRAIEALGRETGLGPNPDLHEPKPKTGLRQLFEASVDDILPATHGRLEYRMTFP